jgi:phosphoglycolate phosphatase
MRETVARKPDPAGALEAAALLGIAPQRMLYLGDSAVDMRTARAAGMVPVGALWGFRGESELRKAGSRALLRRPAELLALLDPTWAP